MRFQSLNELLMALKGKVGTVVLVAHPDGTYTASVKQIVKGKEITEDMRAAAEGLLRSLGGVAVTLIARNDGGKVVLDRIEALKRL